MKNTSFAAKKTLLLLALSALIALPLFTHHTFAQGDTVASRRQKATDLIKEQKFTEALPILERLVQDLPNDHQVHFYLGFALIGKSRTVTDAAEKRDFVNRARDSFVRSKELGNTDPLVLALINSLPIDGEEGPGPSKNAEANAFMQKAEAAFSTGKLDEAIINYQAALKLDPKLYHAALFTGDSYTQKGEFDTAETWYQKAIVIDPMIETAYRYSATPLMKQKKYALARDRYIEAFITEPYNRFSRTGIGQWAQVTGARLGHPAVDVPEITTGADGKSKSTVNVNPLAQDGSMAWIAYVATREAWKAKKFAEKNAGKPYRHSLAEEADALRSVVKMAKESKPKTLNSEIALLAKLDEEGLLEAFILLALPDEGIAQDHPEYLKQNRQKLRDYMIKYVIEEPK